MNRQLWDPRNPAFQPEWALEDTRLIFYKCTRWQVEETMDTISCPYHYFCDSNYPGNYPPAVDILVLLFATSSYLTTLVMMVLDISRRRQQTYQSQCKRYLLPSGPLFLPIILFVLAKGYRINTIFPLSCIGPAILLLVHISALSFDTGIKKDVKYAFFEASTVSGILHACIYLDSIILPYYTGLDALVASNFSGECVSCVCRKEHLVVGGKLISYRGWSVTTFLIAGVLCSRIISRLPEHNKGTILSIKRFKTLLESSSWILIIFDCINLIMQSPPEQPVLQIAALSSILVLICLHLLKMVCSWVMKWHSLHLK
ncbi:hypothetical protein HS088_TW18G00714 [Tripterygium wilfordii]|uniref:Uncharacterized protein n=1 Tax=Tripterygium wilfordii TaxID=458696 RepID=A0A7J7CE79_TRIWF|nr:uncharacterized protein LOC119984153 [Tripterygium wilfordii]KAF5732026.1 hypothetical protein HS088_TW18G00714 [Tripterygium wilfordii]